MEYMKELSGKFEKEIADDLKGVIFLNPLYEEGSQSQNKYLTADEYLSGNVREKLRIAKTSAELYPDDYRINVEALEKVQPKDLTASEISVRLGATWLPPVDVQRFMFQLLDTPRYAQWNIKVNFSSYTSEWNIGGKTYDKNNVKAYSTYGTSRINAYKIIEETLNLKDVRIFDYLEDADGKKKAVLNKKETAIAQSKQELIKQEFQDWIWSDPSRRERLCELKMLKSNFLSEKYKLEDKVIKFYPKQIAFLKFRIEGLARDVQTAKSHPKPTAEEDIGMMVSSVSRRRYPMRKTHWKIPRSSLKQRRLRYKSRLPKRKSLKRKPQG